APDRDAPARPRIRSHNPERKNSPTSKAANFPPSRSASPKRNARRSPDAALWKIPSSPAILRVCEKLAPSWKKGRKPSTIYTRGGPSWRKSSAESRRERSGIRRGQSKLLPVHSHFGLHV